MDPHMPLPETSGSARSNGRAPVRWSILGRWSWVGVGGLGFGVWGLGFRV